MWLKQTTAQVSEIVFWCQKPRNISQSIYKRPQHSAGNFEVIAVKKISVKSVTNQITIPKSI